MLLENVSTHVLLKDSELLAKTKESLEPLVVGSESEKWVRFHEKEDRPGLFVDFVQRIFATGASIRQASIRTNPEFGVYDWFLIKTNKSSVQLKKLLKHPSSLEQVKGLQKKVRFAEIELVESSIEESILSFRGKDQKGALVVAAQTLFDLGLEIRWAAVHTWGRSLEDVFGVVCKKELK